MTTQARLDLAAKSLKGLSVGDAFGETFFGREDVITERIQERQYQEGLWNFTDDTVMSIGIYKVLRQYGEINQDALALEFARNYQLDDYRGYGGTAHSILKNIGAGQPWKTVSSQVFDGMGSAGNGAAMRSALIGAYWYDDIVEVKYQARLAAAVTHTHPEAIAGAIAVALAANTALRQSSFTSAQFLDAVIADMPESDMRYKLKKAATLPAHYDIRTIVSILGNGTLLTALDTVPFALWCTAHHLDNFEEALWTAVSALGDRDTIAAIIGSIVVLHATAHTIPLSWQQQTEPWEHSVFYKD